MTNKDYEQYIEDLGEEYQQNGPPEGFRKVEDYTCGYCGSKVNKEAHWFLERRSPRGEQQYYACSLDHLQHTIHKITYGSR